MSDLPFPLWGKSSAILETRELLRGAAETEWPVLLLGESGAGKQAAAEWIHRLSGRRRRRFVDANTACWNGSAMIHSTLFGHERGAFTGANARRIGLFEQADGGTLFLDEIGELSVEIQPMLLKVLDQGFIEPLGANSTRKVDARLVAATNRDLEKEAKAGRFRRDLLSRISALEIRLPSLSERAEDVEDLWRGICGRWNLDLPLPDDVARRIESEGLPDNLRGLERIAIRASVWGKG